MSNPKMNYDFEGWATRSGLKCSDGRTIARDAFKDCDGTVVPLVWAHKHDDPSMVLGHALLESRDGDIWAYGFLNNSENGKQAKEIVQHGDVCAMSIYAKLQKQVKGMVMHGDIKEVSLVLAGANPGAFIENVIMHGEFDEDEAILYQPDDPSFEIRHADNESEETKMPDASKNDSGNDMTVQEVFNTLSEDQKTAVYAIIDQILKDDDSGDENGGNEMKHNLFDENDHVVGGSYLSHSDMMEILRNGKKNGSLREGYHEFMASAGVDLAHAEDYGIRDIDLLFPEAKALHNGAPEFIDVMPHAWVDKVMKGVHHVPFSRIKSMYADITEDEARARGYIKGKYKKEEVFSLLKRATQPTTVYKKQKFDKQDIDDITDFDVLAWVKTEMRGKLNEELARAFLLGDGRLASSDDKIDENCIRPIVSDADLFTVKFGVKTGTTDSETARELIRGAVKSRKHYRGSGHPVAFTTEDWITEMLLLEDGMGRRLYPTEAELKTALRVDAIEPVSYMENFEDKDGNAVHMIIVNLADYSVGADKGGNVDFFDDFDLDYNQMKYLIETRCSASLTKPFSAIVLHAAETTGLSGKNLKEAMAEFKRQ